MAKAITWGECLDYTLRNLETWRNGGGRESAILYSGYFTRYQGRTFPAHRISKGLMTDICTSLEEEGKRMPLLIGLYQQSLWCLSTVKKMML